MRIMERDSKASIFMLSPLSFWKNVWPVVLSLAFKNAKLSFSTFTQSV